MKYKIKDKVLGFFLGTFLGLGIFEKSIDKFPKEVEPVEFDSLLEASKYCRRMGLAGVGCVIVDDEGVEYDVS